MTAAAKNLGYVPSAVSQHIAALERTLSGAELFNRKPGARLTTTAAGRALAEAAEELFSAAAAFRDAAQKASRGEGIELRIGAYGTAVSHLLTAALVGLDVDVRISEVEPAEGLPLLERGELDVLIAHRYLSDEPPFLSSKYRILDLGREPLFLTASARSPTSTALDFEAAGASDWVAGGPSDVDRRLLHQWAAAAGLTPRVRYETRDCHVAAELIASGLGVGLLPATVVKAPHQQGRLRIVALPPPVAVATREIMALTRPRFEAPVLDRLLHHIAGTLRAGAAATTPGGGAGGQAAPPPSGRRRATPRATAR